MLAGKQLKIELSRPGGVRRARSSNPNLQSLVAPGAAEGLPHSASFTQDSSGSIVLQRPPPQHMPRSGPPSGGPGAAPPQGGAGANASAAALQTLFSSLMVQGAREYPGGGRGPPPQQQQPPPPPPPRDGAFAADSAVSTPSPQPSSAALGGDAAAAFYNGKPAPAAMDSASSLHGTYSAFLQQFAAQHERRPSDSSLDKAYANMSASLLQPAAAEAPTPLPPPPPPAAVPPPAGSLANVDPSQLSTTIAAAAASAMAAISRDASVPREQQEARLRQHLVEQLGHMQRQALSQGGESGGFRSTRDAVVPPPPPPHHMPDSLYPGQSGRPQHHASASAPIGVRSTRSAGSEGGFSHASSRPVRLSLPRPCKRRLCDSEHCSPC